MGRRSCRGARPNTDGAGNAMQEEPGDTGSGERTERRILRGLGREFFTRFGSRILRAC